MKILPPIAAAAMLLAACSAGDQMTLDVATGHTPDRSPATITLHDGTVAELLEIIERPGGHDDAIVQRPGVGHRSYIVGYDEPTFAYEMPIDDDPCTPDPYGIEPAPGADCYAPLP